MNGCIRPLGSYGMRSMLLADPCVFPLLHVACLCQLCVYGVYRADHAASKYLKDTMKVPKARDQTIKEALGRFTRLNRI